MAYLHEVAVEVTFMEKGSIIFITHAELDYGNKYMLHNQFKVIWPTSSLIICKPHTFQNKISQNLCSFSPAFIRYIRTRTTSSSKTDLHNIKQSL